MGAQYLTGATDGFLLDMGGTTTDITVITNGRPALNRQGARVGRWQTMVEAIDVRTTGLGGDSEVRLDGEGTLCLGPARVIPLCLLAAEFPAVLTVLAAQVARGAGRGTGRAACDAGCFILRRANAAVAAPKTDGLETEIMDLVGTEPLSLADLLAQVKVPSLGRRIVAGLAARGLLAASSFTPTDALHVLDRYRAGSGRAATLGAALWAGRLGLSTEDFCGRVVDRAAFQLGQAVVASALASDRVPGADQPDGVSRLFIARGLDGVGPGSLGVTFRLQRPLIAIGAPVGAYLPAVAARLGARLIIPEHAEVGNAVGAVAGRVSQRARILIRPVEGSDYCRAYLPDGYQDFDSPDAAVATARETAGRLAQEQAIRAGGGAIQITVEHVTRYAERGAGWMDQIFVEAEITATATGRPWVNA